MLKYSGIPLDEISIKNVVIDEEGSYVRTMVTGDISKPRLVLVHGYGGSGLLFYKIMKQLAQHFSLILIDIIGMGASSRVKFVAKTAEEADEFFIDFLEKWRIAMDNLTDFILAGHSFGGYITAHYAVRYP